MRKIYYTLFAICSFLFVSCEQENIPRPIYENMTGEWELESKIVKEYIDGDFFFEDSLTSITASMNITNDGIFKIVSDASKQLNFADASRYGTDVTAPNGGPSDTLGGIIKVYNSGNQIHFDVGQPEFVDQLPFLCTVDQIDDQT